jgi:metal-dependent amidase/aminoacylase/carboxypeptidase family protein
LESAQLIKEILQNYGKNYSAKDLETTKILPQVVEWRRHLHQYPELSNREFKTAEYVEKNCAGSVWKCGTKIAKTGVVGF